MNLLASIKLLITAGPALVQFIAELAKWLEAVFGQDPVKAIQEQTEAVRKLREAKTPNEKMAAAHSLSSLLRRL